MGGSREVMTPPVPPEGNNQRQTERERRGIMVTYMALGDDEIAASPVMSNQNPGFQITPTGILS